LYTSLYLAGKARRLTHSINTNYIQEQTGDQFTIYASVMIDTSLLCSILGNIVISNDLNFKCTLVDYSVFMLFEGCESRVADSPDRLLCDILLYKQHNKDIPGHYHSTHHALYEP